jgi:hypothetical protein
MTGKPKNPTRKHEKCPDCDAEMGAAFVRIKHGKKRKWSNKDIKVCTNPCCSTVLTHIPRNIYYKRTKINVAKKLGLNANDKAKMLDVLAR